MAATLDSKRSRSTTRTGVSSSSTCLPTHRRGCSPVIGSVGAERDGRDKDRLALSKVQFDVVAEAGKAVGKDAAQGKATLVELEGIEGARASAARFCRNAVDSLDLFGDKADLLRQVARSVMDRRS